jgi:hypothetical protein
VIIKLNPPLVAVTLAIFGALGTVAGVAKAGNEESESPVELIAITLIV